MNALASVIRGTGNMLVPALRSSVGVVLLVPLSPCLIFGIGPFPALGIAGAGIAVVSTTALTARCWPSISHRGRSVVRLRLGAAAAAPVHRYPAGRRGRLGHDPADHADRGAGDGAGRRDRGPAAVAGYGTGNRLEYLLVPLAFGLGAPLVALVGTNLGAGRRERALRIAFTGAALAFVMTEAVGLAAAFSPEAGSACSARSGNARSRRAVFADCRAGLRVFRHGSGAVFRLARRWSAAVAALGRADPPCDCGRRRLARPALTGSLTGCSRPSPSPSSLTA